MSDNDDKLFGELFGDEEKAKPAAPAAAQPKPAPAPKAAPKTAAPAKPAAPPPAAAAAPVPEEDAAEAARLFQEMMAGRRADDAARIAAKKAEAAAAAAAKQAAEPEPIMPIRAPVAEEAPVTPFAASLAPWTLFKGVSTIGMLVYIVGFHGRLLKDEWPTLAVITVAAAILVLAVDFAVSSAAAKKDEKKPKASPKP